MKKEPLAIERLLLTVLKRELWQQTDASCSVCTDEFLAMQKLAEEHAVLGLAMHPFIEGQASVRPVDAPNLIAKQKLALQMLAADRQHRMLYVRFQKALHDFAQLLEREGIPYVVFKGLAVAEHYPHPYLRTMGDVDFYVPPACFERAVRVIEKGWGVAVERDYTDKHFSFDHNGLRFEMHFQIETFGLRRHQRLFNRWMDETVSGQTCTLNVEGAALHVLPPLAEIVVVFKHMFNHLLVEGVGLRQVLDLAVLLDAYKGKVDMEELHACLKDLGYLHAFHAIVEMLVKHVGLAEETGDLYSPHRGKRDAYYADRLFKMIMESGNFGRRACSCHTEGWRKSVYTARQAWRHCLTAFGLIPCEMLALVPKRVGISIRKYL